MPSSNFLLHVHTITCLPGFRVNLVCTRSCRVNGIPVPEGMNIHVPVDMLHQMPEYWDRPQAFSLER